MMLNQIAADEPQKQSSNRLKHFKFIHSEHFNDSQNTKASPSLFFSKTSRKICIRTLRSVQMNLYRKEQTVRKPHWTEWTDKEDLYWIFRNPKILMI